MKVLAILMIAALAVAQAQPPPPPGGIQTGGGGWVGGSPAIAGLGFGYSFQPQFIFQDIILQNEAQKLLAQVDLPEDLQLRIADVLAEAQLGFDNCNATVTMPWLQIRCSVMQLQKSKNQLKAIDNEAKARAAAAAAAPAPAPA